MKYAIVAVALVSSAAALAQTAATGSIRSGDATVSVPEGHFTGDAARAISDRFAACVVRRHHQPVISALQMERDSSDQYKAMHRLLDAECWGGNGLENQQSGSDVEMTTNPFSFRGALAKAIVKQDFARRPESFSAEPIVAAKLHDVRLKFADCVVRSDPASALRVLGSIAGTSAEEAALAALQPPMSQCLAPEITLSFSKGVLVAYLAEAYVLEADAAKPVGAH